MLVVGLNKFKQTDWSDSACSAASRIWYNSTNPKKVIRKVVVKRRHPDAPHAAKKLRKIAEMVTWCLNEGEYMTIRPDGSLENKFMCLILTAPYAPHHFTADEVRMTVDYIMACLNASAGPDDTVSALATYLRGLSEDKLSNPELRDLSYQWYQLMLTDLENKITQLEKVAA
jgi:hypothetical protein